MSNLAAQTDDADDPRALPSLEIEVTFQPPTPSALSGAVAVVLDIFRATTVHAALFSGGADRVYPVADFAAGVGLRSALPGSRLIGEVGALPPPEADFGNSPTEFASMDVNGWTVVHVTSNGTRALVGARKADLVLSGCLRNMSASVEHLLAARPERVVIVCSGDHGGNRAISRGRIRRGSVCRQTEARHPGFDITRRREIGAQALWRLRTLADACIRRLPAR